MSSKKLPLIHIFLFILFAVQGMAWTMQDDQGIAAPLSFFAFLFACVGIFALRVVDVGWETIKNSTSCAAIAHFLILFLTAVSLLVGLCALAAIHVGLISEAEVSFLPQLTFALLFIGLGAGLFITE